MKNILLIVVIAFAASCTKTKVAPVYGIENTNWTLSGDTSFHLSFTASTLTLSWSGLTPNPSTLNYTKLTRDTIYIPSWDTKCAMVVSKDSLIWTSVKSGVAGQPWPFYRH